MKIFSLKEFNMAILVILLNLNLFAQKQIAITIDDPNTKELPLMSWQERNNLMLKVLDKHKIKVALFVCGMRVGDLKGKTLLKSWDDKNHLICNHSYSHLYFNSKSISSAKFISDFMQGDSIIKEFKNYTKLFRFPYLKEGNTAIKRDSMRTFLAESKYKNGSVTIDASDWYIDSEIIKALKEDINADTSKYKKFYIQHILDRANYYDSLAQMVFGKKIKHTLLIHHSLLNALFLDDLLVALKENGWKLIDAKKAFKDEIFNQKPLNEPCGESIVWQCAKLNENLAKSLRYPPESDEYEKIPLKKMIQEYK